jgi:hypothetical protein
MFSGSLRSLSAAGLILLQEMENIPKHLIFFKHS